MVKEFGFHVIDARLSIEEQQVHMREIVMNSFGDGIEGILRMEGEGDWNVNGNAAAASIL
jgi:hypothetical protein